MTRKIDWANAASFPPEELNRLLEEDRDEIDDNPPLSDEQLAAMTPGTRRPGQRGPGKRPAKEMVALRVEPATLKAWRESGTGWQTRMGELLTREAPKAKRQA